jgi:dGTPase
MAEHGGFEHNLQSLRVVDELEERYPTFNGLNLSFETREGILKHCSRRNAELLEQQDPAGVASRFLRGTQPSLEAQLCNLADAIAYNAHDIDDGVRSGLLTLDQLQEVSLFARFHAQTVAEFPGLASRRQLFETIRRMLSEQVYDVISATRAALLRVAPSNVDEVRRSEPLVRFSPAMHAESQALKSFLFHNLYRHPKVMNNTDGAKAMVHDLFVLYVNQPQEMPVAYAQRLNRPRAVADYLAGMTDRFASREHARLQLGSETI